MSSLMKMDDLLRLAEIVREETGNKVGEKNFSMLESRMRAHIANLGFETMDEYWRHFGKNEDLERGVIQSLMTTHYTFFFREYIHFETLGIWINDNLTDLKARGGRPVTVWSAACSRGQEVYSLAMFLERNLLSRHGIPYEVHGTDIDAESIAYAANGVYPIKEVNTIANEYLRGNWKRGTGTTQEFAAVHPNLKKRTKFSPVNLVDLSGFAPGEKFDVIFCRNVFIYFTEERVQAIAKSLADRLANGGLFVSGLSEPLRFPGWTLPQVGPSVYRKQAAMIPRQKPAASKATLVERRKERYKVLCVDDSPTIQNLLKKIFSADPLCEGVDIAGNGREARVKLEAGKYDLITLDIHMPEVDGLTFLEKLYDRKAHPPVLMVSSVNRSDADLATKSLALGAFDYVEKPAMNNLQKSGDEILTKSKMAMRSKERAVEAPKVSDFDSSISQKIVVPDASQSLRVVTANVNGLRALEQIVRGQANEYRSPALLILWHSGPSGHKPEAEVLKWTERPVSTIHEGKALLTPNRVYIAHDPAPEFLAGLRFKSVSLQILDASVNGLEMFKATPSVQVLLDESAAGERSAFERRTGLRVSDVTPATSFPSLSIEFFAKLRKAAA